MPLGLHADCKSRLVDALAEAIPHFEVRKGKFLERFPTWLALHNVEKVLPIKGKIRDQLINYIDDRPFTEFVMDTLAFELDDEKYISEGPNIKLTALERYKDSKVLAVRLVEAFESLPHRYTLSLRLPKHLDTIISPEKNVVDLSSKIRIVRTTPEFKQTFSLETTSGSLREKLVGGPALASLFFPTNQAEWEENELYLQIGVSGFIGVYGGSNTHQDAQRTLRAIFGLGLALQLFETKVEYSPVRQTASLSVHRERSDSSWEVEGKLDLNDTVAETLNTLRLSTANGWVNSQERQDIWSERIIEEIRSVFQQEEKAESILLAAQWYFDGSHGADELLRYVQSMIVIEIILGDKATSDQMGLNELLRNRCAYLIGNSQEQRAEVLETFKSIYDVRSQIVHRGKHRLTSDERGLLNRLRWMCLRVIQKEVDLLNANKKTDAPLVTS
jgi:Apea-like HEPN